MCRWFDSAPGHQETPKPPSGGFLICCYSIDVIELRRDIFFWSGGLAPSNQHMYNVHMTSLRFEWEPRKASANLKKHGISFEEAKSVFYDESAKLISDPDHSEDEDRFILLGVSHSLRVILVCHCYRSEGNVVRIISARKATPKESKAY